MTMAQKINMAVVYKEISQAALARAIDMTPSILTKSSKENPFPQRNSLKLRRLLAEYINLVLHLLQRCTRFCY